jgi:hypothetical protein
MQGLAASLHGLATLVFVAGSALVGVRLLLLARRSRQVPELLLGGAILCAAVLGYGVLIAALVARGGRLDADSATPATIALWAGGKALHDLGVTFFLLFVVRVFRTGETWALALAGGLLALLWGGYAGVGLASGFRSDPIGSAAWWCEYAVVWTYPLWMGLESLRWWRLMRRRRALGLAGALVTNRFLLWGVGSGFTALAIWTASVPYLYASDLARLDAITPLARIATAATGLASITCTYLAFLPPAWYRRRVVAPRSGDPDAVPGKPGLA